MKRIVAILFLLALTLNVAHAIVPADKKVVLGEWKYSVPSAPIGYDSGTFVFAEKEGKLVGEVKFSDGYGVELINLDFSEGKLKFGLYVDTDYVSAEIEVNDNKMIGVVTTPDGKMPLTAEKVLKEKK